MKSVTQLRSMKDIRTCVSAHARSAPRLKGTTFLEVYLLDMERQRLDTELAMLAKRQGRIQQRLSEIGEGVAKLLLTVGAGDAAPTPTRAEPGGHGSEGKGPAPGKWRRVPVGY